VDVVRQWYFFLSQLSATLGEPLTGIVNRIDFPLASALLLGLLGATAPCQLTTNLSAIAYVSRDLRSGRPWLEAVAYTLGKVLVYIVMGGMVIGLGLEIQASAVPVVIVARKLLGPVMIMIGMVFLGVVSLRSSLGHKLAGSLQRRVSIRGPWRAFVLGAGFAFAFCPTLFLLFFGLAIPLGLRSHAGLLVPGLFALGTALPLLVYAGLLAAGNEVASAYVRRFTRGHSTVKRIAGLIFLLAGINDTVTYWLL
jgi:sulfite exporter TauE/SafE